MKCTKCGSEIAVAAKFCGACGAPAGLAAYCASCGASLADEATFCGSCGTRQSVAKQSTLAQRTAPPPGQVQLAEQQPRRGGLLAVLAGIPVLGLLFSGAGARGAREWDASAGYWDYGTGYSGSTAADSWDEGSSSDSGSGFDSSEDSGGWDSSSD